jgi:hypothetical protein
MRAGKSPEPRLDYLRDDATRLLTVVADLLQRLQSPFQWLVAL